MPDELGKAAHTAIPMTLKRDTGLAVLVVKGRRSKMASLTCNDRRHGVIGAGGATVVRFDTPMGGGEMLVGVRECGPHSRRSRLRYR